MVSETIPRQHIGGSAIGALLDLYFPMVTGERWSPYKTAFDVYASLVHGELDEPTLRMKLGKAAEGPIIDDWAERHGVNPERIQRSVAFRVNRGRVLFGKDALDAGGHLGGEFDGLIAGECGIEAKNINSPRQIERWQSRAEDDIPVEYLCQVAWYRRWAGVPEFIVVAALNGEPRDYKYRETPDLENMAVEAAEKFWTDHVAKRVPPKADFAKPGAVRAVYPRGNGELRRATAEETELCMKLAALREQRKALEVSEEELEAQVKAAIGGCDGLTFVGGTCTWKAAKDSISTDWEAVANALNAPAELIAKHKRVRPGARRFLLNVTSKEKSNG